MLHQRSRTARPRHVVVAAVVAVLAALVFTGAASAEFPYNNTAPSISGTPQEGQTLQGHNGLWLYTNGLKCEDCTYAYRWQTCNPDSSGCVDLPGETKFPHLVTAEDVGRRLRFVEDVTKTDCNALNQDCRTLTKNAVSSPTAIVTPKPVAAPVSTAAPTVTGTPMEDEVLTAHGGTWTSGSVEITTKAIQWQRCDAAMTNCDSIPGATKDTYRLTSQDVGFRARVAETAGSAGGYTTAVSAPTQVVLELRPTASRQVIPVTKVTGAHRLIIDRISPARLGNGMFTVQFRIRDDRGFRVAGALVQTSVIPDDAVIPLRETRSNANGWAVFTFKVASGFKGGTLWFYVTARKPGEKLQSGSSTSTLFKLRVGAPAKK
jgi:hypothetical protein